MVSVLSFHFYADLRGKSFYLPNHFIDSKAFITCLVAPFIVLEKLAVTCGRLFQAIKPGARLLVGLWPGATCW